MRVQFQFQNMQPQNLQKSLFIILLLVLCIFVFSCPVNSQIKIPSKLDGFWYSDQGLKTDSIFIEAFLDPVCPDSRDSWPPLKQALRYYASRVSLIVYPFPLPYHDNSFICSRALHIVDKLNIHPTATFDLLERFFKHQEVFYGQATFNLSRASTIDKVVKFSAETAGVPLWNTTSIKQGFNDSSTDQATRHSFKFGCLKGVYGTPFFFVNGFPLPDNGTPSDYNGWKKIIDPLVSNRSTRGSNLYTHLE